MRVRVLVFGILRDLFPDDGEILELPQGSTVERVLEWYRERAPAERRELWPSLAAAVNRQYASRGHELREGDEVALLPPVSGGVDEIESTLLAKIALVREAIDSGRIIREIKQPSDGAIAVFDGIVRDNSRGRATHYLVYEAYEPMAIEMLGALRSEAMDSKGVRDVIVHHRLGRLEIGETSVLIAAAAAHRAQAFEACRWLIDTLKKTVPIWKREYFEDGAVWADGEPFPASIGGAAAWSGRGSR